MNLEGLHEYCIYLIMIEDKAKPGEKQGRKAMGLNDSRVVIVWSEFFIVKRRAR